AGGGEFGPQSDALRRVEPALDLEELLLKLLAQDLPLARWLDDLGCRKEVGAARRARGRGLGFSRAFWLRGPGLRAAGVVWFVAEPRVLVALVGLRLRPARVLSHKVVEVEPRRLDPRRDRNMLGLDDVIDPVLERPERAVRHALGRELPALAGVE